MASENTEEILEFFFCLPHECWSPECFITHLVTQNKFSKKDELFRKYYSDLRQISIDERFSPDARQCAKDIFGKKDADKKKRGKILGSIEERAQPIASTSNSERSNSLDEALSFVPPPLEYPSDASTSTSITLVSGRCPASVKRWSEFLDDASNFLFSGEEEFEKPKFVEGLRARVEPEVDTAVSVNIGLVLNKLLPQFEFGKQKSSDFKENPEIGRVIPDITCRDFSNGGRIIFPIEVKRNLVVEGLISDEELALEGTHARALKQIYNYMIASQTQYGVLTSYDYHWFLRRPKEHPEELHISDALRLNSTNPTVLKSYAYLATIAAADLTSPDPNIR
ncbi:hypothetical protein C2G38_2043614 [Gigaspora rosea]|uniref:Uncharacterized protein n=1 Tax=Gigaspora rosea TaxID=44941 RepID=A0A397UJ90_9GLOM|nr:hypothetical protein C2G38_2043614 [Gigaspora rosea]